jgi:hypothetical protein
MEHCGDRGLVGSGLDLLGADDALASQYITLRVKSLDREKMKLALGGNKGLIASSAMSFVDLSPKAAIDAAVPLLKKEAAKYGADLDVVVSDVPPSKGGRAISEFWPGLVTGTVIGGCSLILVKLFMRLAGR